MNASSTTVRRVLLTLFALAPAALHAQGSKPTYTPPGVLLTPAQTATLARLAALQTLPPGAWRFHSGDLPHGESPALDDSAWPLVQVRSQAPAEAVWYRRTIEVPASGYDLTGASIDLRFVASSSTDVTEILYFNGRRVALGEDLEPIQLFSSAKPGEKILVAVKLLPTPTPKTFRNAELSIHFAASRPNPQDLLQELRGAASLVPSLPNSTSAAAAVQQAIDAIAPASATQAAFDASLTQAEQLLAPIRPLLQQFTLHLTGNSHIDAAWLWPSTETVEAVRRTFSTAAQLLSEYPTYTYTQSAAVYSQWMADKYPALNKQIKQRIDEGRWELVGGMWLEPDLNMPDGESLVRQLLIGQATFKRLYGHTTRIGWNPDSFGYNWQLPQIYKRSGIDYFVTQKMAWNDTNELPLKLFWWQSPDGSKILTYFPHDYANESVPPVRLERDLAVARHFAPGMTDMMDLYGVGDHGGGPTREILDQGLHWMEPNEIVPHEKYGTAQPYFTHIESQITPASPTWNYATLASGNTALPNPASGISIPTWRDELYLEYHRGVFTTQADHKRSMRDSEEWLLDAEKLASLAWLDGRPYPAAELSDAWKLVLFNQFHDLAAGSGIGVIYKDAQKDYAQVHWAADEISSGSLATLAARIDTRTPTGTPVLVFNSLAWPRPGLVELSIQMPAPGPAALTLLDPENRPIPSQILSHDASTNTFRVLARVPSVPSVGYLVLHAIYGPQPFPSDLKATSTTLENAALRVTLDLATGCITSLFDKHSNFESLAPASCANELQAFKDTPRNYDAWNIDPGTYDVPPTLLHAVDSMELVDSGPLRATLRVTRHWQSSRFTQDITLYAGDDQLLLANDIDWHETHVLLKAAFPLAASGPMATYEIPYGSIQRPTTRNNSWEKAKFEVPALRWADLGDSAHGVSLLNNSKYGYDAAGNVLRLTLLRSPTSPDPDADRHEHHFTFALYPHAGTWQQALTPRRGYEFNYPLQAHQVAPHTGTLPARHSFVSVDQPNVVLTALKKSDEDSSLTLRFFEWAGKASSVTLTIPPGASAATLTNLMELPEGGALPTQGDHLTVPITPFQIQTVRISYPQPPTSAPFTAASPR